MRYEELYEYVGQMGRIQWIIFAALFALNMFCMEVFNMIFVGGQMDHWCLVEELSSLPDDRQKYLAIPPAVNTGSDVVAEYSRCEVYSINWTTYSVEELAVWNRTQLIRENVTTTRPCTAWNYDRSTFASSIVSRVRSSG